MQILRQLARDHNQKVWEAMQALIETEDKLQPRSDRAMAELISEQGTMCGTWTILKLRHKYQVPSTRTRLQRAET